MVLFIDCIHRNLKLFEIYNQQNQPRIARTRAAALLTRLSDESVRRKRRSLRLSEATRIRRFSKQKAKFPTAINANLCT